MKLKIAVQKSGRLYEESIKLLKECGIAFNNGMNKLRTEALNFPLEVLFLRDDDIPQYVADKVTDVGIVGENVVLEKGKEVEIIARLGFARCRLSLAIPKFEEADSPETLQNKKIATSYPRLLQEFLDRKNIKAEIHEISGSVELAPGIGLADAICDLVSSGSTLLLNGLRETEVVLESEAVLISNDHLEEEKQAILQKLLFRIGAVQRSKRNKYILMNVPDDKIKDVITILPGIKSPTIMPLAEKGWSSVHTVVHEDDFWNIIENLKMHGAQGILVIPIEKMVV